MPALQFIFYITCLQGRVSFCTRTNPIFLFGFPKLTFACSVEIFQPLNNLSFKSVRDSFFFQKIIIHIVLLPRDIPMANFAKRIITLNTFPSQFSAAPATISERFPPTFLIGWSKTFLLVQTPSLPTPPFSPHTFIIEISTHFK